MGIMAAGASSAFAGDELSAPVVNSDAHFYAGVYGGADFHDGYSKNQTTVGIPGLFSSTNTGSINDGLGSTGGAKFGYAFNSFQIHDGYAIQPALEIEGMYIGNSSGGNTTQTTGAFTTNFGTKNQLDSGAFFLNNVNYLKNPTAFTPYLGFGLGVEYTEMTTHFDLGPGAPKADLTANNTSFAFQALVGCNYQLRDHWIIFTEYKFIDAVDTNFKYPADGQLQINYHAGDLMQNLLTAGVKYQF